MGTTSLYGQKVGEDSLKNNCTMLPQVEVVGRKTVKKVSIVAGGIVLVSQDRHSVSVEGIVMDKMRSSDNRSRSCRKRNCS